MAAPVARVTRLRILAAKRFLFALADDNHAIRSDADADQIVADRGGAPLPEREVVLVGATRVGVSFNGHAHGGPSTQVVRVSLQRGTLVVANVELVVIEADVRKIRRDLLECFRPEQILFRRRLWSRRRWSRCWSRRWRRRRRWR